MKKLFVFVIGCSTLQANAADLQYYEEGTGDISSWQQVVAPQDPDKTTLKVRGEFSKLGFKNGSGWTPTKHLEADFNIGPGVSTGGLSIENAQHDVISEVLNDKTGALSDKYIGKAVIIDAIDIGNANREGFLTDYRIKKVTLVQEKSKIESKDLPRQLYSADAHFLNDLKKSPEQAGKLFLSASERHGQIVKVERKRMGRGSSSYTACVVTTNENGVTVYRSDDNTTASANTQDFTVLDEKMCQWAETAMEHGRPVRLLYREYNSGKMPWSGFDRHVVYKISLADEPTKIQDNKAEGTIPLGKMNYDDLVKRLVKDPEFLEALKRQMNQDERLPGELPSLEAPAINHN